MSPMRLKTLLIFCVIASPAWVCGQNARQGQANAARASAIQALRQQIEAQPLGEGQTIADFVEQTHAQDKLEQLLQQSPEIGGVRWLDTQTCQVRLRVEGLKIAEFLQTIASAPPSGKPIDLAPLQPFLRALRQKNFEATSTSASANSLNTISPAEPTQAWSAVAPAARRAALLQARQNAIHRIINLLGTIELTPGITVASQMQQADSPMREKLLAYLQTAPIVSIRFEPNLQVQIELRPSWQETADTLYSTWSQRQSTEYTADDFQALQALREQISHRLIHVTGSAVVNHSELKTGPAWHLPAQPPAWVDDQLEASGHGFVHGDRLRSARAGEHAANVKLADQLRQLRLDPNHTVLDAARLDPNVARAINQSIESARPYKSEYNADGSVTIHEILNLRDFWQALQGSE